VLDGYPLLYFAPTGRLGHRAISGVRERFRRRVHSGCCLLPWLHDALAVSFPYAVSVSSKSELPSVYDWSSVRTRPISILCDLAVLYRVVDLRMPHMHSFAREIVPVSQIDVAYSRPMQ